jgi:TetR/AcrR family transcriptional repressor of nem operon
MSKNNSSDVMAENKVSMRERMLMTAFDLFHEQGLNATSVDDILKASGAGKSQFYHYFKSKEGLIHELLQLAYAKIKGGEIYAVPQIESWDDFRFWLDGAVDQVGKYGCSRACPIGQFSGEISEEHELLRQDIKLIFDVMKDYPRMFFVKLQARGELVDGADPDAMADMCVAALQGGFLLAKVNRSDEAILNVTEHIFAYMKSLAR